MEQGVVYKCACSVGMQALVVCSEKGILRASASFTTTACALPCSFYPLNPPAAGAMLDSSHADKLHLPITPDILLLPSDLNAFAKLVPLPSAPPPGADPALPAQPTAGADHRGQVVCVNPGRLTKGTGGGTFSCFQIGISAEGKAAAQGRAPATNGKIPHQVHTRCKVTIKRV